MVSDRLRENFRERAVRTAAFALFCFCLMASAILAAPACADPLPDVSVTQYHNDGRRDGLYVVPGLTWQNARTVHRDAAFNGGLPGHVYAQPLYWRPPGGGRPLLVIATEDDVVIALDPATGDRVWSTRLGRPVPRDDLPCGNISPLGITGTPIIDAATGAVYLDAMALGRTGPAQEVFGLRLSDGKVLPGWPVDVGAALAARGIHFVARLQNQRAALAMLDGKVFVAYGGNWGDCGSYRGIVLGFRTSPPALSATWATRGVKGGIWAPAGISSADGRLYFATGNTEIKDPNRPGGPPWDDGEAVFREGPSLAPVTSNTRDWFAPANYAALSEADLDLGGVAPLPIDLPDGSMRLLALGKDGLAYLLNRSDLGGIGGALGVRIAASGPIITAPAVYPWGGEALVAYGANGAYCPRMSQHGNFAALAVGAKGMHSAWCTHLDGRGAPIVTTTDGQSDPIVWVAGAEGDNLLHAFRGSDGKAIFTSREPMPGLRHFVTPIVADGRIYIAGDNRVFAFSWSGGPKGNSR